MIYSALAELFKMPILVLQCDDRHHVFYKKTETGVTWPVAAILVQDNNTIRHFQSDLHLSRALYNVQAGFTTIVKLAVRF